MPTINKSPTGAGLGILGNVPQGRKRALAPTNLEQASMWSAKALREGGA